MSEDPGRPAPVVVTGAAGFLGRHVVSALLHRGYSVRAIFRGSLSSDPHWPAAVERFRADLCEAPNLADACAGARTVVHLAARMTGNVDDVVRTATIGTRRVVEAMATAGCAHLVMVSSLSVYDWRARGRTVDEDWPLEAHPEGRDAYTVAKLRQEEVAHQECRRRGLCLTVLRPAALWGIGHEIPASIGPRLGPIHLVFGDGRPLAIAHVTNCADAIAAVVEADGGAEGVFNVVDPPGVRPSEFLRRHLRSARQRGFVIRIPSAAVRGAATLIHHLTPSSLRPRLPAFIAPARFAARYASPQVNGAKLQQAIGWRPRFSFEECLALTYHDRSGARRIP